MPKELTGQKKGVKDLQQVVSEPAMGQSDLDDINQKVSAYSRDATFPTILGFPTFYVFLVRLSILFKCHCDIQS